MKTGLSLYGMPYQVETQRRMIAPARSKELYVGEFRCLYCGSLVSVNPFQAGVNNRNHCPYCLWSRHLDLNAAGDRLSACKQPMQPVGLTLKQVVKRYAQPGAGELLLIHRCSECERLSINRLAADDSAEVIREVFEDSWRMVPFLRKQLEAQGIRVLQAADNDLVKLRLYGSV